jgi:hypothetical protein
MFASGLSTGLYYTAFKAMSFLVAVTFSYFFNKRWVSTRGRLNRPPIFAVSVCQLHRHDHQRLDGQHCRELYRPQIQFITSLPSSGVLSEPSAEPPPVCLEFPRLQILVFKNNNLYET